MKIIKSIFNVKNIKWIALLIIIVIVILIFTMKKEIDVIVIKKYDLYQYLTGIKIEYTGNIVINKTKDEITTLTFDDQKIELDSTPVYFNGLDKAIFPKNMAIIYPLEGLQFKVNYYSTIYTDFDELSIKDRSLEKRLFNSIIYDGSDLYFITEKSTVSIGTQQVEVSPLSYVIADTFNKIVTIYDYESDTLTQYDNTLEDVIISNGDYKVNASLDLIYYGDSSKLLIKNINGLKNLSKD